MSGSFAVFFRLDPDWLNQHGDHNPSRIIGGNKILEPHLAQDVYHVEAETDTQAREQLFIHLRENFPTFPESAWIIDACEYNEDDAFGLDS